MTPILLEDHLEQGALQRLAGLGWTVAHGPDISPPDAHTPGSERDSYRQVVLEHRLSDAIRRPANSDTNIGDLIAKAMERFASVQSSCRASALRERLSERAVSCGSAVASRSIADLRG